MDLALINERFKSIGLDGWLEDWDIKNIYEVVSKLEPSQTYLEIGVAKGKSMATAALAAHADVNLYGIDLIDWQDRDENIRKFLAGFGRTDQNWHFIQGDSQEEAKFWSKGHVDALYIDGDHTYLGVLKDLASWLPWVNAGGIIMMDDYNSKEHVKQVVDEIFRNHQAFTNHRIDGEMYLCQKL